MIENNKKIMAKLQTNVELHIQSLAASYTHNINLSVFFTLKRDNSILYLSHFSRSVRHAVFAELFYDGGRCHIKTSPLICKANQLTGFFMITASVTKELKQIIWKTF